MTKRELKKLRKKLPKGWADTLAIKFRHSVTYIRAIIYGDKPNEYVVSAAIDMAEEYQKQLEEQKLKIKSL